MNRQEAAQEARRLRSVSGRRNALEWIKAYKFYSGTQWTTNDAKFEIRKLDFIALGLRISFEHLTRETGFSALVKDRK